MSSLAHTTQRVANFAKGKGYKTDKEKRAKAAVNRQKKLDKQFAGAEMPDEELIRRNERRKAAKRRGSRISTVLTGDELG